jgi:AraC-like DNA-binding protein
MSKFNNRPRRDVLYRIRESSNGAGEHVRAFDPGLDGLSEVFHATFTNHVYPLHSHDTWTVLIVDAGLIRYDIGHDDRGADTRRVTVLPPHVAHDGQSALHGRGFRKRVLYLDSEAIGEDLVGRAVDNSTLDDPGLRSSISRLHMAFDHTRDDLEWETLLKGVTSRIRHRLTGKAGPDGSSSTAAATLRDYLESHLCERLRLESVARRLGWNKTHLIRSFCNQYGIPPHRYLIGRRVEEARRHLLAGLAPAEVAVRVGFYDQAHLTRHFRSILSTTPGRFQRSTR